MMFAKPVLTRDDVRDALNSIAEARNICETNPLLDFALVRQKTASPEFIAGAYARVYAVAEVFEEILLAELGEERRVANNANSVEYLRQDFQSGNTFLQAYSLIYYRYLRPQLGMAAERAAQVVGFTPRTMRRRLIEGIGHLTLAIVREEVELRRVIRITRELDATRDITETYNVVLGKNHRTTDEQKANIPAKN